MAVGICTTGAKVYAKSELRQAYDERRDRIAARCVKDGNAAKIRAWVGKSSKHAKKNATLSEAQVEYRKLSNDPSLTEPQRVKMLKPMQLRQKIVDDAEAERRTAYVPSPYREQFRRHRKRNRAPLEALPEAPLEAAPEAPDDVSTDSSMDSDSDSTEKGSEGMGSSTDEE